MFFRNRYSQDLPYKQHHRGRLCMESGDPGIHRHNMPYRQNNNYHLKGLIQPNQYERTNLDTIQERLRGTSYVLQAIASSFPSSAASGLLIDCQVASNWFPLSGLAPRESCPGGERRTRRAWALELFWAISFFVKVMKFGVVRVIYSWLQYTTIPRNAGVGHPRTIIASCWEWDSGMSCILACNFPR